jgi:ribonuclease BN (tRNA processing enzyme)
VRVTVEGSGDAFGSGARYQTCIALTGDGQGHPTLLVDCGATALTALCEQQIDPNRIRTVVVSHVHGDHFGGLPFLILDGQFRRRTPSGCSSARATARHRSGGISTSRHSRGIAPGSPATG